MNVRLALALAGGALLLASCAAGPDYRPPAPDMPREWTLEEPWRVGNPGDSLAKGPWWRRFNDGKLDALQERALAANPTLAMSEARLAQSRASLAAATAGLYPQLGVGLRANRFAVTENRPLSNYSSPNFSVVQNDFIAAFSASYEADLAGRVRRTVEGARATAEQSAADFENTRLLLTADLATAYFSLRALDIELDVLLRSIQLQRQSLAVADARHDLGAASGLDVAQQQALLDSTLTQVDVLRRTRSQFEHAIASLTGTPAPLFSLAPEVKELVPPAIPLGVPSDILQRRPDVAAAERAMAAANAQVGVANAAFYPSITLGALFGTESRMTTNLFDASRIVWSLGTSLAAPLFDGGRLKANLAGASAGYDLTAANYRRVVLAAMQEVEDGITGLAALERASIQAMAAIASARRVLELANARYEGGVATSLDVIVAQQGLLSAARLAAQLAGQRIVASVFLVKALGGDWPGPQALASQ